MTRKELEHIIRASGNITNQYEFVILGSQSILGAIPNPSSNSKTPWPWCRSCRWRPSSGRA
jgi:hypothetical protein